MTTSATTMMMLPLSVYQLLQSADRIDIVCDNPVRPVHSYTESAPPVLRKRRKTSWKDRRRANNAAPASCRWSPVLLSPPLRVVPSPSAVNDPRAGYASFSPATVESEGRRRRARPLRQVRSLSPVPAMPVRKAGFVDFPPPPVFLQDDDDDSSDDIVDVENSEDDDISNQTQDDERGMSGSSSINDSSSSSEEQQEQEETSELEEAIQRAIAITTTAPRRRRGRRPTRTSAPTTTTAMPSPESLSRWIEPPLPRGPYESPPQPHVNIAQQMRIQRLHNQERMSSTSPGLSQHDDNADDDDNDMPNLSPIPSSSSLSSLENTPNSSISPPLHVFSRWDSHPSKIAASSSGADAPPSLFSLQAHHRFRKHLRASPTPGSSTTSTSPHHPVTEEKLQPLPTIQTRHWSLESIPNVPPLPVHPPPQVANANSNSTTTTGSPTIMVDPPKKPVRRGSFERPRTPPSPSSDTAALLDQALRITTTTTAAEDDEIVHHSNHNHNSAGHYVPTARLSRP